VIDLRAAPEDRWREVGREHAKVIQKLLRRARRELEARSLLPPSVQSLIEASLDALRRFHASHEYVRELDGYADAAGVDVHDLYLGNITYDFTLVADAVSDALADAYHEFRRLFSFGCTGFVHGGPPAPLIARNMDWTFPKGIGDHTLIFRFVKGSRSFLSVGFPGVTGVISGLSSAGFAITVNQAPLQAHMLSATQLVSLPVLWLTRHVFDESTSYRSATRRLLTTASSTPAFFLVAGRKAGEAMLVQSTGRHDVVTKVPSGQRMAIANHFITKDRDEDGDEDSIARLRAMRRRAANLARADIVLARGTLARPPVKNADTVQRIVLAPSEGQMFLRARASNTRFQPVFARLADKGRVFCSPTHGR
jgi:hypothetical protein